MKTKPTTASVAPTLYKVLTADGHSPYITAYAWSLPTKNADGSWTPGAWHEEPASVFDRGHGLHITPAPGHYWPQNTCVAYECEASGYREDPLTDHHVVALRVRLLRPVSTEEAVKVSDAWNAARYANRAKAEQKRRLDKAREAATKTRANEAACMAAGVESPALTAFRLLVELTPTESWRDVNGCRLDALRYATKWLRFNPDDVGTIYNKFRGGYWFGENGAEYLYALAISCKNTSACAAWEKFLGRKPWWLSTADGRTRLAVGADLTWQGYACEVTSFNDEKDAFVACAYKVVTKGTGKRAYEDKKLVKRFTITREAFKQAFGSKKTEDKAA